MFWSYLKNRFCYVEHFINDNKDEHILRYDLFPVIESKFEVEPQDLCLSDLIGPDNVVQDDVPSLWENASISSANAEYEHKM